MVQGFEDRDTSIYVNSLRWSVLCWNLLWLVTWCTFKLGFHRYSPASPQGQITVLYCDPSGAIAPTLVLFLS